MKKNPKVSVIIPAFNEEKYLARCLNTVVTQTLDDIEIIIVDDCSSDGTYEISENYKQQFPDIITVIHKKKNEGLGFARNTGIKASHGQYIGFVDADDWIDKNMYEEMYKSAKVNDSEIVVCDVRKIFVSENKECVEVSLPQKSGLINIGEYIKDGKNPAYSWNKLYKREIWEKYKFRKMVYEDLDIVLTIMSNCKKISYVQKPFNTYFKRQGSITTSYTNIRLLDIMKAYKDAVFECKKKYSNEIEFCVAKRILINMNTPGFSYYTADFIETIKSLSRRFYKNKFIKDDIEVSQILNFLKISTIPKNIYMLIDCICYEECISSLNKTIRDYSITKFSDIEKIFLSLYKHGGIYVSAAFNFSFPLGGLRNTNLFVIYDDKTNNIEAIGGQKHNNYFLKKPEFFYNQQIFEEQNFITKKFDNHKIIMLE